MKEAITTYGRRAKRFLKTDEGDVVAIIRGDNFSYERGRKEALRKALKGHTDDGVGGDEVVFDRKTRANAWKAVFPKYDK